MRTNARPRWNHLKLWLVERPADGQSWREVGRKENNNQFNGTCCTATLLLRAAGSAALSG
jgi:hypothetical protein